MGNAIRRAARLAGALLLTGLIACSGRSAGNGSAKQPDDGIARAGRPAPDWTEPLIPTGTLSMHSLRGKVVYLNFFATWCPPCNEEAPWIAGLQRRFGPNGLQVVGVDVLESTEKAALFRKQHGLDYPIVADDGALRDQYQINGLPVHAFIDRSGVVRSIVVGELSAAAMQAHIEPLLR
jgi:cytochrome c biogenesis protein CcmG/thiol:disulfide interchange protein DsbE